MESHRFECKQALQFCQELKPESVKLIITSPPYNIGKSYEKRVAIETYLEEMQPTLTELVRILSPQGSLCWQVGNYVKDGEIFPLDIFFYPLFKSLGLKLRNRIIWHFGHGLHCSKRFSGRYETILWFTKSDEYTFNLDDVRIPSKYPNKKYFKGEKKGQLSCNPLGKNPEDVWNMTIERLYDDWERQVWDIPNVKNNHPEKVAHPCQYPVELAERCVLALSNVGDTVYDPFAGVASTLIAAIKNERVGYGSEIDADFVAIGECRIRDIQRGRLATRQICQPIFDPKKVPKKPSISPKQGSLFVLSGTSI